MILAKYIKIGDKVAHQDLIAIGEILDIYESSGWVAVEILWDRHVQGKYVTTELIDDLCVLENN